MILGKVGIPGREESLEGEPTLFANLEHRSGFKRAWQNEAIGFIPWILPARHGHQEPRLSLAAAGRECDDQ